jgi:selenocysteine lyase/cysteine desulfurase
MRVAKRDTAIFGPELFTIAHGTLRTAIERMVIDRLEAGGMVRVGPVHYNTLDEIEQFGEALKKVASQ